MDLSALNKTKYLVFKRKAVDFPTLQRDGRYRGYKLILFPNVEDFNLTDNFIELNKPVYLQEIKDLDKPEPILCFCDWETQKPAYVLRYNRFGLDYFIIEDE